MSDSIILLLFASPTQSKVKVWGHVREGADTSFPTLPPNYTFSLIDITWTTVTERNQKALHDSSHLKYAHAY